MEERGLSNILNAEGEKLRYVLGTLEGVSGPTPPTIDELLQVNNSLQQTLATAIQTQMLLQNKMSIALNASQLQGAGGMTGPTAATVNANPVVPAYNAVNAAIYPIGQLVMSDGRVYAVVNAPPLGTPGSSRDYALLGG